jgi:general secretion pathway protein K
MAFAAPQPLRSQRGAALLTAMIIVTLLATLVAAMVLQQRRAVQVEAAERSRVQSAWILNGALDWARLILREDKRSGRPTALTEPWATPLAEARLSTFLAADVSHAEDGPDAFLSGVITDAQARYNLFNLIDQGKVSTPEVEALQRLCQAVGVADDVAARIATGMLGALSPTGRSNTALRPQRLAQLTWLGIDSDTIARLEPYVTLLPTRTPVNVNTASREVLVGAIKGLDLATAERLIQLRQRDPFKTTSAVEAQLPGLAPLNPGQISTVSDYFEVRGRLRLEERVLEQRSLVVRRGLDVVVLRREQVAAHEALGT